MAFDPDVQRSKADRCFYYQARGGQCFLFLVHVDDCAVTYSKQLHVDAWLAQFRGTPDIDGFLDAKLIDGVTHLLHMRITRQHQLTSLDRECQIDVLATEYGVKDCEPTLTPMADHQDLMKMTSPPPASIPSC